MFDPRKWRPQTPTTAYMELRDDDAFWAARRVAAFTDELIRAAVHTGEFSDPAAEKYLGRRADQAPRQDRQHLPDRRQSDRQSASRRERPLDVRERGGRRWRGERPGDLPRVVVSLRQRDRRHASRSPKRRARRRRSRRRAACRRRQAVSSRSTFRSTAQAHPAWKRPVRTLFPPRTATAGRSWGSNACPETLARRPRVSIRRRAPARTSCRRATARAEERYWLRP